MIIREELDTFCTMKFISFIWNNIKWHHKTLHHVLHITLHHVLHITLHHVLHITLHETYTINICNFDPVTLTLSFDLLLSPHMKNWWPWRPHEPYLYCECGQVTFWIIIIPDAWEDLICEAERGVFWRNKTSHLC